MFNKEDEVIKILAEKVVSRGYQLLSFDLPEHGERKDDTIYLCKVQNCVKDLKKIIEYAKKNYEEINLWAYKIKKKLKLQNTTLIGLQLVSKAIHSKWDLTILKFSDNEDIQE